MDTEGTMDISISRGAQYRALIEKGSCSTKKRNSARGLGRGKRLPVSATSTVEIRHLELSRVTEPTTPTELHQHLQHFTTFYNASPGASKTTQKSLK